MGRPGQCVVVAVVVVVVVAVVVVVVVFVVVSPLTPNSRALPCYF